LGELPFTLNALLYFRLGGFQIFCYLLKAFFGKIIERIFSQKAITLCSIKWIYNSKEAQHERIYIPLWPWNQKLFPG